MSHPLYWPSKQFFYPIGNTPAVSLTRDLSPEQPADILLLGCGDPRNILFTLYSDVTVNSTPRKMNVTCCDLEPGILARNILLFSLLENNEPINRVWDIFYHFKIDSPALKLLVAHSRELFNHAQSIDTWQKSRYSPFLKMVDSRTLGELGRYWKDYAEFPGLPSKRLRNLSLEQSAASKSILDKVPFNISASRSAGMLWHQAMVPVAQLAQSYWKTGTTFTRPNDISSATQLNPTFIYSLSGETFNPHYGTFPGAGFHLSPAFAVVTRDPAGPLTNAGSPTFNVSKQQFRAWCESFRAARAANAITLRFYTGDALAFCRALESVSINQQPNTHIFASAWRAPQITLDKCGADSVGSTTFDVVDTSNLADHLGLLNLLIAASPLLKKHPPSQAVLYTETLIPGNGDATESLLQQLCTDVPTLACLLGIAPRSYLSGFTTESSVHELPMAAAMGSQLHERIAWVDPRSGDHHVPNSNTKVSFAAADLVRVLHGMYQKMFSPETLGVLSLILSGPSNAQARLQAAERMHFNRETFALLFRAIQRRVILHEGTWVEVAGDFLTLIKRKISSKIALEHYQDLCLQFHVYGIYSVPSLDPELHDAFRAVNRTRIFSNQLALPTAICVTLVVPRRSLQVLLDDPEQVGNPILQCSLFDDGSRNSYSALHATWGKLVQRPDLGRTCIWEGPEGMNGHSDLVVSFWAHSRFLELPNVKISLGIKASPRSAMLFSQKLGPQLDIFITTIKEDSPINISTYRPSLVTEVPQTLHNTNTVFRQPTPVETSDPTCHAVVNWPGEPNVHSLSVRFQASSALQQQCLHDGSVSTRQIGPCTVKFEIGDNVYRASYVYPVRGSDHEQDINKDLNFVDAIAPVPNPSDHPANLSNPFPIIRKNAYTPWNMHHLHLDRLPVLGTPLSRDTSWLRFHSGLQFSDRERKVMHDRSKSKDTTANILTEIKRSIEFLLNSYSGADGHQTRSFLLCGASKDDIHAIFLVGGIRLDLSSSTVVADTALVPLSKDKNSYLISRTQSLPKFTVSRLTSSDHEMIMWKRLFPALVERCRIWEHKPSCEYASKNAIPASLELGQNPLCSCGQGNGFKSTQWKVPEWRDLLPLATRAAISPIFSVPYIERTTLTSGESLSTARGWRGARIGSFPDSNASSNTRFQLGRYPTPANSGGNRRYSSLLPASTRIVRQISLLV